MPRILYRDETGKRIPSVTTILGRMKDSGGLLNWAWDLGLQGKDLNEERKKAADSGTVAHDMIEGHILGNGPYTVPTQDEEILAKARKGYQGFLEWQKVTNVTIDVTEVSLVHDYLGFGGTLDARGRKEDGSRVLLDWKTSNRIYGDYILQLAAYKYLWEHGRMNDPEAEAPEDLGEKISDCYILRFDKEDGSFHWHTYPEETMNDAVKFFTELQVPTYHGLKKYDKAA